MKVATKSLLYWRDSRIDWDVRRESLIEDDCSGMMDEVGVGRVA